MDEPFKPAVEPQAFLTKKLVERRGSVMKLDHVVYFTEKDLSQIVDGQRGEGRHAIIGGRHEKWGTYNALLYMKNAYVEWLAVEHSEIAKEAHLPLIDLLLTDLQEGEGWGTICLSVEGIERFNEEIENKGFRTSGVLDAQRRTVNGQLLKWKLLFVEQSISAELPYPFFIEWEEPEENRTARLKAEGSLSPENERLAIQECIFHVKDPLKETAEWAILLSQKVGDAHQIALPNVTLKFVEHQVKNDRLADVVIGQAER